MIFEIAVMVALSTPPIKLDTHNETHDLVFDSGFVVLPVTKYETKPVMMVESGNMDSAIARDFATLPDVCHVLIEHDYDEIQVWIAIDDSDSYAARSRVYDKQLEMLDGFPEANFDFNLIPAMGRSPKELRTGAKVLYSCA